MIRILLAVVFWIGTSGWLMAATWGTDQRAALEQAKREEKAVLLDFTGSDWCGWCIRLKSEVFDTPEFVAFADANLVLVELDFPKRKALPADLRERNEALATKYHISGFPTIVILDADGNLKGQLGYTPGGARAFIRELKKVPGMNWKESGPIDKAATAPATPPGEAKGEEPLWAGMNTSQKKWENLKLTGLSGPANRRLAIINNQTFAAGETARVKLNDTQVRVSCREIRNNSVVVQVGDSPESKEIFLGQ